MAAHVAGEALARNATHLRADHLDCAHERIGEQERPTQGVAELCASLRIGGYAAGIVVRRARDEARPHDIGELRPVRLFDLVGGRSSNHVIRPCLRNPSSNRNNAGRFRYWGRKFFIAGWFISGDAVAQVAAGKRRSARASVSAALFWSLSRIDVAMAPLPHRYDLLQAASVAL